MSPPGEASEMVQDEFVLKRKRRRFTNVVASGPSNLSLVSKGTSENAITSSSIHKHPSTMIPSTRKSQLPVEDFFLWSISAPTSTRHYKRRRAVVLSDDSDDKLVQDSGEEMDVVVKARRRRRPLPQLPTSDDEYQPPEEGERNNHVDMRKQRSSKGRTKSLKSRMLRAAVLSHVDIDARELRAGSADRNPLKFATKSGIASPVIYPNPSKIRLVDPRKVTFHSPAFRRQTAYTNRRHGDGSVQGFTRWVCPPRVRADPIPSKMQEKKQTMSRPRPRGIPLTFVRADAQRRHSNKLRHRCRPPEVAYPDDCAGVAAPLDFEPLGNLRSCCPSPTSVFTIVSDSDEGETGSPLHGLSSPPLVEEPQHLHPAPSMMSTENSRVIPQHP